MVTQEARPIVSFTHTHTHTHTTVSAGAINNTIRRTLPFNTCTPFKQREGGGVVAWAGRERKRERDRQRERD